MRWYYEKKELRNSPSIQAGFDNETESRYRREGARFILDIGSTMNLSLTTMATGVVYFHRFYMIHTFQDFSRYPTALACLFLAGKVEETPKKCKDMLKVAKELLSEEKFPRKCPLLSEGDVHQKSEEIMTLERIILQTIKFDLHVEHPYTYLLKYAKCLKGDKSRLQKMVQMAWTFVNDSLCTTLCLQWEPEIIAIALMHLAGKLSKFEVRDWNGRTSDHFRWWDMFVEDMTIELLEDICHQVLDLYSQTQAQNPAQGGSPPPPGRVPVPTSKPPLPSVVNSALPNSTVPPPVPAPHVPGPNHTPTGPPPGFMYNVAVPSHPIPPPQFPAQNNASPAGYPKIPVPPVPVPLPPAVLPPLPAGFPPPPPLPPNQPFLPPAPPLPAGKPLQPQPPPPPK